MSNITQVIIKYQYAVLYRNVFTGSYIEFAYVTDSGNAFHTFAAAKLKDLLPNSHLIAPLLLSTETYKNIIKYTYT